MTKQKEERGVSHVDKVSGAFLDQGYSVKSHGLVNSAWRIHEGRRYNVLEFIVYRLTSMKKIKEDKRIVSRLSPTLHNQLIERPDSLIWGLESRKLFGINTPYYRGKQVMIVTDKLLVSESCDESDSRFSSIEVVPRSELSSVLGSRKNAVLKIADSVFKPDKGEVLRKANSRARYGLFITLFLTATLIPFIFINVTDAIFQLLMVVDSVLLIASLVGSFVIYELGVSKFKNLLREELYAFVKPPQEPSKQLQIKQVPALQAPKVELVEDSERELQIEKPIEPPLEAGGNPREYFTQRVIALWDNCQKKYDEGDWNTCAVYLTGAVSFTLKGFYLRLTGKESFENELKIAEFICKRTGLDFNRFRLFFDRINGSPTFTEAELTELYESAQELITDLQTSAAADATFEAATIEKGSVESRKDLLSKASWISESIPAQRTAKMSSKAKVAKSKKGGTKKEGMSRKSGKPKTGKVEPTSEELEELYLKPKVLQTRVGGAEANVTSCDSFIGIMCAEADIQDQLKKLIDSKGGLGDSPAFLVVTQSPEVARDVGDLEKKYPEAIIGVYEHFVNGKAQIIVSLDGGISNKIDYESPRQLERLISSQTNKKTLNDFQPSSSSMDNFTDLLEE